MGTLHYLPAKPRKRAPNVRVDLSVQRARQRSASTDATLGRYRARNELGVCATCPTGLKRGLRVYCVPDIKVVFCMPCGLKWQELCNSKGRDECNRP